MAPGVSASVSTPLPSAGEVMQGHSTKQVTILVTGFGPFAEKFPINPSFELTKALKDHMEELAKYKSPIHVIPEPQPIRVAFEDTRKLVPELLEKSKDRSNVVVVHIGMAAGQKQYLIERYARKTGYIKHKDIDGKLPPADEAVELFSDCPERMTTSLKYDDILQRWQSRVGLEDLPIGLRGLPECRPSEDAGLFMCEYIYYNSLTWFARKHKQYEGGSTFDRPVLFFHVPAESDPMTLHTGKAVLLALLKAIADSCAA